MNNFDRAIIYFILVFVFSFALANGPRIKSIQADLAAIKAAVGVYEVRE